MPGKDWYQNNLSVLVELAVLPVSKKVYIEVLIRLLFEQVFSCRCYHHRLYRFL